MSNFINLAFGSGPVLGRSVVTGERVRLKDSRRSTHIIGVHGSGKSALMLNLILDDIRRRDKGILVLDPHGDLAKAVALRCPPTEAKRITYFAPAEQREQILGLNPFEMTDLQDFELRAGALMDVFAHSWYGDFRRTPTLHNTLETLIGTLLAAHGELKTNFLHMLFLTRLDACGDAWRNRLAPFVANNPAMAQNWREWENERRRRDDLESSRQKIKHIMASDLLARILCQPQSAACFQFKEVLSHKGVLLVNLEGLNDEGQRLIGSIILTQLRATALSRYAPTDRLPCHIYADEFHVFSPETFVRIVTEMRKFSLFATLAHQNLGQLSGATLAAAAACGNVVAFRVNPEDASTMGRHFVYDGRSLPPTALANLPRFQAGVRYDDKAIRRQAFIETFREKGRENPDLAEEIRRRSASLGTPAATVQQYINDTLEETNARPSSRGSVSLRTKSKKAKN